jgi:uncharacterized protein DUF6789
MRPRLPRAFVGGLLGTAVITLSMYFVSPVVTGGPTDIAAMLGEALRASWIAGMIAHFVVGTLVLPGIYVLVLYPLLLGSPPVRGVMFGTILWLITQVVVMPMMGGGLFSEQAGGLEAVIGSLIGQLVYGLVVGTLAGGTRGLEVHDLNEFELETRMRRAG